MRCLSIKNSLQLKKIINLSSRYTTGEMYPISCPMGELETVDSIGIYQNMKERGGIQR